MMEKIKGIYCGSRWTAAYNPLYMLRFRYGATNITYLLLSQLLGVKIATYKAQKTAAYDVFSTSVTKLQLLPEEVFQAPRTKDPKWIHHQGQAVHQQCQPISHNNNTRRADGLASLLKHLLSMRLFCVPCISCMLDTQIHQQQQVSGRHQDHFII